MRKQTSHFVDVIRTKAWSLSSKKNQSVSLPAPTTTKKFNIQSSWKLLPLPFKTMKQLVALFGGRWISSVVLKLPLNWLHPRIASKFKRWTPKCILTVFYLNIQTFCFKLNIVNKLENTTITQTLNFLYFEKQWPFLEHPQPSWKLLSTLL